MRFTLKLRVMVLTRPLSFSVASTTQRQTPSPMTEEPTTLRNVPGRDPRRERHATVPFGRRSFRSMTDGRTTFADSVVRSLTASPLGVMRVRDAWGA